MEKFGFLFAGFRGGIVCVGVFSTREGKIIETYLRDTSHKRKSVWRITESETEFNSFEELDQFYYRKSQCTLLFQECESLEVAGRFLHSEGTTIHLTDDVAIGVLDTTQPPPPRVIDKKWPRCPRRL